jgi:Lsr2
MQIDLGQPHPILATVRTKLARRGYTLADHPADAPNGNAADGTVPFGLDGTEHEIDLNSGHAQELRDAPTRSTKAARQADGGSRRPGPERAARVEGGGQHRGP